MPVGLTMKHFLIEFWLNFSMWDVISNRWVRVKKFYARDYYLSWLATIEVWIGKNLCFTCKWNQSSFILYITAKTANYNVVCENSACCLALIRAILGSLRNKNKFSVCCKTVYTHSIYEKLRIEIIIWNEFIQCLHLLSLIIAHYYILCAWFKNIYTTHTHTVHLQYLF